MSDEIYRIVEHDGGWAYKLGDVFSETFPNRQSAEAAANRVAEEQRSPGEDESISWEDERGIWHDEDARGADRPNAYVAGGEAFQRPLPDQQPRLRESGNVAAGAPDYLRSATPPARRAVSSVQPTSGIESDSLIVMLLTIALAYVLGIVVGRNA